MPLVEVVEEAVRKYSVATDSVINFGCATGLNSFLLSTTFQKVHVRTCMYTCMCRVMYIHYDRHGRWLALISVVGLSMLL